MRHKHVSYLAVLLSVAVPCAAQAARTRPYQGLLHVLAEPRAATEVETIWALSEHVLEPHDPALTRHQLVITSETLGRLRGLGVPVQVTPLDPQRWIDELYAQGERPAPALFAGSLGIFGPFFNQVPTLEAINTYLDELAAMSGGRAKVVVLGKSVQGRDIKAMRISTLPEGADRPGVVVTGTQHAREWASPVVAMGLIDALVRQYPADPAVRRVVDNVEIFINPVNNVDGYVATFNGRRLQRRNMNPTCNVDLNRNYDTAWGMGVGGSCSSDTYPGTAAFSEPESQAIKRLVESLKRPALLIDYHSTAAQVMIPYAYTTMRPPGYEQNRALCELYSTTLRGVRGTNYPARPGYNLARGAGGGAFDWFRAKHGDTIVVELGGGSGFSISNQEVLPFAEENFVAWLAVVGRLVEGGAPVDGGAPPPRPPDAAAPRADTAVADTAVADAAVADSRLAPDAGTAVPDSARPPPATPDAAPPVAVADGAAGGGAPPPAVPDAASPGPDRGTGGCACALGERPAPSRWPSPIGATAVVFLAIVLRRRRNQTP